MKKLFMMKQRNMATSTVKTERQKKKMAKMYHSHNC